MIQMVKAGVLDVAKVSASSLEQFNPAYSIFSLPYVFQSTEHYFKVMEESRAVQEIFKSTYDQGFLPLDGMIQEPVPSIQPRRGRWRVRRI